MIKKISNQILKRKQFLKFIAVGFSGLVVNMLLLWLFVSILKLNVAISGIIAIETSVITNFILNNSWTFNKSARRVHWTRKFAKYQISVILGMGINYIVLITLTKFFGIFYLLSNLIGIGLATVSNYLLSSRWAWKD